MKNLITRSNLFLMLFTMLIISSCHKNKTQDELNGSWSLRTVSCECEFIELEPDEQIWIIDVESGELTVENNVTEDLHTILETGIYPIEVDDDTFTLNEIPYEYVITNGELVLDHMSESDGPLINFTKN